MADKKPWEEFSQQPEANPDAKPWEQFGGKTAPSGFFRRAADYGIDALKGAVELPQAAVGLTDLVTGGQTGKALEGVGYRPKEAIDSLNEVYSPERQAANKAVADAKGFFPTIAAAVQNPSTIVGTAVESAPSMLGAGGIARGALKAGLSSPVLAGAIGEGALSAGQNAEQVRAEDPNGTLTPQQSAILAASGALTGALGYGAGRVANKLGIGDVETMLAQGRMGAVGEKAIEAGASKGFLRKAGEGFATEGVLQELPQSYQEQVAQNLAQGKPWSEGAAEAGAQGMLAGGLTGAPAAILEGGHGSSTPAPEAPQTAAPAPSEQAPNAGPMLALPPPVINVDSQGNAITADDRNARTQFDRENLAARMQRINSGDIIDVTPISSAPERQTESQAMGIDPNSGPISSAAAIAVDSGAHAQSIQETAQALSGEVAAKDANQNPGAAPAAEPVTQNRVSEIQSRMDFIQQQGRATGWNKEMVAQRKQLRDELGKLQQQNASEASAPKTATGEAQKPAQQASQAPLEAAAGAAPTADIKSVVAKQIPQMSDAEIQQAIDYYGPDHKRTPKLQKELSKRGASPSVQPAGVTNVAQAPEAQQAGTQPSQAAGEASAAAAPAAAQQAPGASSAESPRTGVTPPEGLTNAPGTSNAGTKSASPTTSQVQATKTPPVNSAQGEKAAPGPVRATREQIKEAGDRWQTMTTVERTALSGQIEAQPIIKKNLPRASFGDLNVDLQHKLTLAMQPREQLTYENAKADAEAARARSRSAGDALNAFPKLPNGLTPDEVKATPEWQAAKRNYDNAFNAERAANSVVVKNFPKENIADIKAERERRAAESAAIEAAAHEAATSPKNDLPEPTQAQKEAGNYTKGHINVQGLDVTVENPRGSERTGKREDGSEWRHTMSDHYGYIKRTQGADGEQVDVYVGPKPESSRVFVVDQLNQKTGGFDEHKVMMGFDDETSAKKAYSSNFDKGWKVGPVREMSVGEFKDWLKDGDTTKPAAEPAAEPAKQPRGVLAKKAATEETTSGPQAAIKKGDTIILARDIDYATAGRPYVVESVNKRGISIKNTETGNGTSIAWFQLANHADYTVDKPNSDGKTSLGPNDFIPAPKGGLDYGEITSAMSGGMRRQAGKIRLRRGNEKWGLMHIEARHGAQFKSLGFDSAQDFIAHVAESFNAIYPGNGSGLSLVLQTNRTGGRLMVQLTLSEEGDFYDVKSASPIRGDQFKNEEPLWQRAGTSAPTAQGSSLLPKDQSGNASVDQFGGESKPSAQTEAGRFAGNNIISRVAEGSDRTIIPNADNEAVPKDHAFPLNEAASSYSGLSHSGTQRAKGDAQEYEQFIEGERTNAEAVAETDEQKAALSEALDSLRTDYLGAYGRLMNVRAGTYSGHVAGRSGLNAKQANTRNDSLTRAMTQFAEWKNGATGRVRNAVLKARTEAQREADTAARKKSQDDQAERKQKSDMDLMRKILSWKKGDQLPIGKTAIVAGVNLGRDGYPSSVKLQPTNGEALTSDKFDLAALYRTKGMSVPDSKRRVRELVDAVRAEDSATTTATEPAAAPADPASKTPLLDSHVATMDAIRAGTATAEQLKESFARVESQIDAIKAELATQTKEQLLRAGGATFAMRNRDSKKAEIVDAMANAISDEYALGRRYGKSSFVVSAAGLAEHRKAQDDALRELVANTTDEDIKAHAKEIEQYRAEAKSRREANAKAISDPQTLSDFRAALNHHIQANGETRQQAYLRLTPEQRQRYDDLEADQSKAMREERKNALRSQGIRAAGQATVGNVIATKHTKQGHDLFVVQLADRVSREDYDTLNASAKRLGGNYSSYRGNGAVPGFQFRTRESADAFSKLVAGDTEDAQAVAQARRDAFADDRSQTGAERLRAMAEALNERADASLNQDRKTNTARRASMANSAESAARADKALAGTMSNLAGAIERGDTKYLDAVRQKVQVEYLAATLRTAKDEQLRQTYPAYADYLKHRGEAINSETVDFAKYPNFTAMRSDLADLGRKLLEIDGTKKLGQRLMSVADDVTDAYTDWAKANLLRVSQFGRSGKMADFTSRDDAERAIRRSGLTGRAIVLAIKRGENRVVLSPSEAMKMGLWEGDGDKRITLTGEFGKELVDTVGRRAKGAVSIPWALESAAEGRKRLEGMGLYTPSEFRAALREFVNLQEAQATPDKIKQMERAMIGRRNDGLDFFPTSDAVVDSMLDAAEITDGMSVLEPSAGMGHIADAIREKTGVEPDVVELSGDRRELLDAKGYNIVGEDFTGMNARSFTYGDVFRHEDGRVGVMAKSGGMGSGRVGLAPLDDAGQPDMRRFEWVDRDALTGIEKRGSSSGYDRIIMNPPFSKGRDIEHVKHAFSLLRPGGRLVAIMGEGAFFQSNKAAESFRNWLDELGATSEKLPEGSFLDPNLPVNTGVNARMVVIDKPANELETGAGIALLSRSDSAKAMDFRPISLETASGVIAGLRGTIQKVWNVDLRLVPTFDALPQDVKAAVHQYGDGDQAKGVLHQGVVYVVADEHGSESDLEATILHEIKGHVGIRRLYGPRIALQLNALYASIGGRKGLAALAAKRGFIREMQDYASSLAESKFSDPERTQIIVEELLSHIAQDPKFTDKVKAIIGGIRAWLRAHGFKLASYGETDLLHILSQASTALETVRDASGPVVLMRSAGVDPNNSSILGAAARSPGMTRLDKAVFGMAVEGQKAADVLGLIKGASHSQFNRQLAGLLLKTGINPSLAISSGAELNMGGKAREYAAVYYPAKDSVFMFRPFDAERHMLHEFIHAATAKAIEKTGLASTRMNLLYQHVKKNGGINELYGMKNVDEFVAEAFTNPDFQQALRQIEAPAGSALRSAWDAFVRIVKSILGMPAYVSDNALSSALDLGLDLMRENMALRGQANGAAMGSIADAKAYTRHAVDTLNQTFSAPGKVSWWHKTVGTMYNLAERSPEFKRVFDAAQGFVDDVSKWATDSADMAPTILPKLETWQDIAKKPVSAEDNKAVARPIFEGTLSWSRDIASRPTLVDDLVAQAETLTADEKAQRLLGADQLSHNVYAMWQGMKQEQYEANINARYASAFLQPGIVWTDAELRKMFGLNDGQIGLYREFRMAIDRSLDTMARSDMLRYGGEDAKELRDAVMNAPSLESAAAMLRDHFAELAQEDPSREEHLMVVANGMMDRADKVAKLAEKGYAPLSRFGQYTVDVVEGGERKYFGLFETAREANKMAERMRKEFGAGAVSQGTLSNESFKLFAGITPETLELFGNALGLDSTGDSARDQAFQEYLRLTKSNRSAMKRLIHRQGIAGYSEDVGRVLAAFLYSNARNTAAGLNIGDLGEAVDAIPKQRGELKDVAYRLADYVKNPQEEAQAIRGFLFAQYLGGSIASAFVNMSQPVAVTFPWLSQFGGARNAAAQLGKAAKNMATKGFAYENDLAAALKAAEDDGTVSPQEVHQLMAQAQGRGSLRAGDGTKQGDAIAQGMNALKRVSFAWGKVFGMAEQTNRRVTFIAAYRIAKQQGIADPGAFAKRAVIETQFQYSKANKMQWGRGAIGGTLMTFKTYSIAYLELLHRMATQGGPEGKKAAALALGVLMVMGGAGGLPFAEDVEDVADGLAQLLGYNFSTKAARQEFLEDVFGKGISSFIDKGITGLPGTPIDVAGRLGMGNLIPGTGLFQSKSSHTSDVLELVGPAGDFVQRIAQGAGRALGGDIGGGLLNVAPQAVRNAAKGADMAATGMYRDAKGYKVLDTNGLEAALKAIGFQPNSVATIQDANSQAQQAKNFYNLRVQEIRAKWAQGIFENDPDRVQSARNDIAEWNEKNPDQRMLISVPSVMSRVKEMRKSKDQRIAASAPKAMRAQLRSEFATVKDGL
jgi:hypothetical protein